MRVILPREAEFLLSRPLELAAFGGVALPRRQVSLVYHLSGPQDDEKQGVTGSVRILALFSMPARSSVLALRRERYELAGIVRTVAAKSRKAIELRVLQYGVTRERLAEIVEEYPGWDVLHVSGHGDVGVLLLEHADGEPDPVSTRELVDLLRPARERLKLAVLSACNSGAAEAASTLHTLGLDELAEQVPTTEVDPSVQVGLARGLVEELGVTTLAMRYPVADGFAVALAAELYPRLLGAGQPIDRAVALALPKAAGEHPTAAVPAASIGTPMLLGRSAIGLRVAPPPGQAVLDPYTERMAWFPSEPRRFVGRTRALVEASTALAPDSGRTGVLFAGMVGAGKTLCALELAHQHRDRFGALAWWRAPDQPDMFGQALSGFAEALETQLNIPMLDAIASEESLRRFLPRLAAVLREEAVLLVLDNVDTLLTDAAQWRDPQWDLLMESLAGHGGLSRVVLTSRVVPAGLDQGRILTLPTYPLSVAESVLLVRELPNLAMLVHDEPTAQRQAARVDTDRALVRRVLNLAQGHPRLLEHADAIAAEPRRLAAALSVAETASSTSPTTAFFATGASDLDGAQFMRLLGAWAKTTLAGLPQAARSFAEMLALIEEGHRESWLIDQLWPQYWWRRHGSDAPPVEQALEPLVSAVMVETKPVTPGDRPPFQMYLLHPGIGEAIRSAADASLVLLVDDVMIDILELCVEDDAPTGLYVWASLASAPYLLRRNRWGEAVDLLDGATDRDLSPQATHRALGYLRHLRDLDADPSVHVNRVYAKVLGRVDPPAAAREMFDAINDALDTGELHHAAAAATDLANLLIATGNLDDALEVTENAIELTRQAGLGPWTQISVECLRLTILLQTGEDEGVLERALELAEQVGVMPTDSTENELATPVSVREVVLSTAVEAAANNEEWRLVLVLGGRIQASFEQRRAPEHEQARLLLNSCLALVRLGHLKEAERLLLSCQRVFEDAEDFDLLGHVFLRRAEVQEKLGRLEDARTMAKAALRYLYERPEPYALATGHDALAHYLPATGSSGRDGAAHRMAAVLLRAAAARAPGGATIVDTSDLEKYGAELFPSTLEGLVASVELVPGVSFDAAFAGLVEDPQERQEMFTQTVSRPRRAAAVAREALATYDRGSLVDALQRAANGERGDSLLEGLDEVNAEFVRMYLAMNPGRNPES